MLRVKTGALHEIHQVAELRVATRWPILREWQRHSIDAYLTVADRATRGGERRRQHDAGCRFVTEHYVEHGRDLFGRMAPQRRIDLLEHSQTRVSKTPHRLTMAACGLDTAELACGSVVGQHQWVRVILRAGIAPDDSRGHLPGECNRAVGGSGEVVGEDEPTRLHLPRPLGNPPRGPRRRERHEYGGDDDTGRDEDRRLRGRIRVCR